MTGTALPRTQPGGPGAELPRLVASTAANLATWHDANLRALGYRTEWRDGWWLTPDDVPLIFFRAIAVRPGADPAVPIGGCHLGPAMAACDPWSELPLDRHGMAYEADRPWMVRRDAPAPEPPLPAGLEVERVTEAAALVDFERAAAIGFGAAIQPPHTWHAPGILADPRFDHWLGRMAGDAVATANGLREAGVLGVYSIATIPDARRMGIASAMTARAIAAGVGLSAVLQPSEMAEPIYRRLGFARFTTFRTWTRRP